jgi:hypothetical protein
MKTKTEAKPVTGLLEEEEVRETLRKKFNDRDHWMMIVHGSAASLMIEIESRFYAGEKNDDFTVITSIHQGQVFGLVAAKKKHMLSYQLISMLRQVTDVHLSERELLRRDLVVVAPGQLVGMATELANKLLSTTSDDLAMQP